MVTIAWLKFTEKGIEETIRKLSQKNKEIKSNFTELDEEIRSLILQTATDEKLVPIADPDHPLYLTGTKSGARKGQYKYYTRDGERLPVYRSPGQLLRSAYKNKITEITQSKFTTIVQWSARDPVTGEEYAGYQHDIASFHTIQPLEEGPAKYAEVTLDFVEDEIYDLAEEYLKQIIGV